MRRAVELSLADLRAAEGLDGWVFFDRGLIDAASGVQHVTGQPVLAPLARAHRFHRQVFLAPPWPEIYVTDPERRHGLELALSEYARLAREYPALGYETVELPKTTVEARADFVLGRLGPS